MWEDIKKKLTQPEEKSRVMEDFLKEKAENTAGIPGRGKSEQRRGRTQAEHIAGGISDDGSREVGRALGWAKEPPPPLPHPQKALGETGRF